MRKNKTIEHLELLWGCFRGGVVLSIAWLFKHIIMTLCYAPLIYLHMGGVIPVIVSALLFLATEDGCACAIVSGILQIIPFATHYYFKEHIEETSFSHEQMLFCCLFFTVLPLTI